MHFLLHVELLQVRAVNPGEDVPIDKTNVVPWRVIAKVAKLGAGAALSCEMLPSRPVRKATRGIKPQPREAVEVPVSEQRSDLCLRLGLLGRDVLTP